MSRLNLSNFLGKTHVIVSTVTAGFQLYTRSAGVAFFIVGALSCSSSVKLLKLLLKQPRPVGASRKVTYGMPSTHAATISYCASYICAACISLPLHPSLRSIAGHKTVPFVAILGPMVVVPWATAVVISRVWLGHHTWSQVAVGSGFGVSFASLWFALWTRGGLDTLGVQCEEWITKLFNN